MKNFLIITLLVSAASGCIRTEKFHGRISSDTVWQGRIQLEGDVYIAPGVKLTVLPGTSIRYTSGEIRSEIQRLRTDGGRTYDLFSESRIEIIVAGELDISGTAENPVVITAPANDPERAGGINFIGSGESSSITHLAINGGYIGIRLYDSRSPDIDNVSITGTIVGGVGCWDRASPAITGMTVENSKFGIGASDIAAPVITRSIVRNNSATGIFFEGLSSGKVIESQISGNNVGIASGNESSPVIYKSTITGNGSGIGCWNESSPDINENTFSSNIVGVLALNNSAPVIRGNIFSKNGAGASFGDSASGEVVDNEFTGSGPAFITTGRAAPQLTGNNLHGNEYGIRIEGRSAPSLTANAFSSNRFGVFMSEYAKPVYSRNTYDENMTDTVDSRL